MTGMTAKELATEVIRWNLFEKDDCFVQLAFRVRGGNPRLSVDGSHSVDKDLSNTIQILNHAYRYDEFFIIAVDPANYWVEIEDISWRLPQVLNAKRDYDPKLADQIRNR